MAQVDPEAFLTIEPDGSKLPEECSGQPKLIRYWLRQLALATRKAVEAKNQVKLVIAEIRTEIRANPGSFGLEKTTVDTVEDAMLMTDRYQQTLQSQVQAEYEQGLIEANVEALRSRDYQLTNLNKQVEMGMLSGPRGVSGDMRQQYAARIQEEAAQAAQDSKPRPAPRKPK